MWTVSEAGWDGPANRFAKVFHSSLVAIGIGEMSGRLIDVNETGSRKAAAAAPA